MKFLKFFFKKGEPKLVNTDDFVKDIEEKLEQFRLNEKAIGKMSELVKSLDSNIKTFQKKIEVFSKEREHQDDLAQKIIEMVSHVYTMDTKINQMEKDLIEIKRELKLEVRAQNEEARKKNSAKQVTFEL